MIVGLLLAALVLLGGIFLAALVRAARERGQLRPVREAVGLGAVTNFFDTLGIGSFASTRCCSSSASQPRLPGP